MSLSDCGNFMLHCLVMDNVFWNSLSWSLQSPVVMTLVPSLLKYIYIFMLGNQNRAACCVWKKHRFTCVLSQNVPFECMTILQQLFSWRSSIHAVFGCDLQDDLSPSPHPFQPEVKLVFRSLVSTYGLASLSSLDLLDQIYFMDDSHNYGASVATIMGKLPPTLLLIWYGDTNFLVVIKSQAASLVLTDCTDTGLLSYSW